MQIRRTSLCRGEGRIITSRSARRRCCRRADPARKSRRADAEGLTQRPTERLTGGRCGPPTALTLNDGNGCIDAGPITSRKAPRSCGQSTFGVTGPAATHIRRNRYLRWRPERRPQPARAVRRAPAQTPSAARRDTSGTLVSALSVINLKYLRSLPDSNRCCRREREAKSTLLTERYGAWWSTFCQAVRIFYSTALYPCPSTPMPYICRTFERNSEQGHASVRGRCGRHMMRTQEAVGSNLYPVLEATAADASSAHPRPRSGRHSAAAAPIRCSRVDTDSSPVD
jgi:hypothetical protein